MTEKQYDDILKSGLILFKEKQLQSIPSEKEIDYEFSLKFKKEMEKLIRNYESSLWLSMQKTGRRVAVFIVALILSLTASLSIKAVREDVFDFFFRVFSDHTEYSGPVSYKDEYMKEYYIIPYLPEAFHILKDESYPDITVSNADIVYINNYGSKIKFYQRIKSASGTFDSEGGEVKEITVNKLPVLYCDNGNRIFCIWNEKDRFFKLIYPSYLGEEYIHKVAGKLEKTAPIPLS
ncbi:MAG: DUF4367 domain-containing protein [Clostridia bacterium]|nr:DUF4367 domain-containing protein [Clostridia bacterium]